MARIDEKDSFKYHKLNNDHYLISAYNKTLDFVEGKNDHKDMTLSTLMLCVKETVEIMRRKEQELKNKDNYIKYLQNEIYKLVNKE